MTNMSKSTKFLKESSLYLSKNNDEPNLEANNELVSNQD
jgi:hypothetical protein